MARPHRFNEFVLRCASCHTFVTISTQAGLCAPTRNHGVVGARLGRRGWLNPFGAAAPGPAEGDRAGRSSIYLHNAENAWRACRFRSAVVRGWSKPLGAAGIALPRGSLLRARDAFRPRLRPQRHAWWKWSCISRALALPLHVACARRSRGQGFIFGSNPVDGRCLSRGCVFRQPGLDQLMHQTGVPCALSRRW